MTGARKRWSFSRLVFGVVLLGVLVGALVVDGYVSAEFHPDHTAGVGQRTGVPAEVTGGGPIIDTRNGGLRTYRLPTRTIALTFDDGPDPRWTPRVMEVLRRHRVNATFFVVGAQVARHPDLVAALARGGDEIGVHSFTHPHLDRLPRWQRELEYSQTQLAVARVTGRKPALLRLPYSSGTRAVDDADWPLIREAGALGFLSVLIDVDSQDWKNPGTDTIVRTSTPGGDEGSIVLMHDAGGDRAQTAAALDRFIPLMRARGYTFTTAFCPARAFSRPCETVV
ncbi:polysaccharide deacetylase family protein, partial [Dactylosporangium fulvum]|uniref:polysaccharide deacetylase family protein n=1 Tax=Dactylosporangium fulvum TaxID=53359 RepID=UPI0031D9C991